jgi:hypothetical protein
MIILWISEICTALVTTYLHPYGHNLPLHKKKYSHLILDLGLSRISKHDLDKYTSRLIQRGFSIGPIFSHKEITNLHEEQCVITLILSIELIQKLAAQHGLEMKQPQEYTSSERLYLASKSIEIIQRAEIICDIFFIHDQAELERISSSQQSISDLASYHGQSIGVFLSWSKYTLLWLQFSSIFGILVFIYQFLFQMELGLSFMPLICILTSIGSLFFDKTLQQHLSLSLFSWGHMTTSQYLPSILPTSLSLGIRPIPPLIVTLFLSILLVILYLSSVILMQFTEVLIIFFFLPNHLFSLSRNSFQRHLSSSSAGSPPSLPTPHHISTTTTTTTLFLTLYRCLSSV